MNMGFQISEEDIINVLNSHQVTLSDSIDNIMSIIDDDKVSKAALSVDIDAEEDDDSIMNKQTDAAYDEIAWQLYQAGKITKEQIQNYGNPIILDM